MKGRSIDFKNEDVFRKLESECYTGTLPYEQFPAAEYRYFSRLRKIYYDYKFGGLPKEKAEEMKAVIYADYKTDAERDGLIAKVYAEYQDNIRMAGTLRSEIDKADNAADKLRLALECIECMTGEVGFAKRNLEGVEK